MSYGNCDVSNGKSISRYTVPHSRAPRNRVTWESCRTSPTTSGSCTTSIDLYSPCYTASCPLRPTHRRDIIGGWFELSSSETRVLDGCVWDNVDDDDGEATTVGGDVTGFGQRQRVRNTMLLVWSLMVGSCSVSLHELLISIILCMRALVLVYGKTTRRWWKPDYKVCTDCTVCCSENRLTLLNRWS